jgi:hypothetical protein
MRPEMPTSERSSRLGYLPNQVGQGAGRAKANQAGRAAGAGAGAVLMPGRKLAPARADAIELQAPGTPARAGARPQNAVVKEGRAGVVADGWNEGPAPNFAMLLSAPNAAHWPPQQIAGTLAANER